MRENIRRVIRPASGFSNVVHIVLLAFLPALVFVFVRLRFFEMATALILLSKWRMLAVKPRHWPANIRANAVDIIVGLSLLTFMIQSGSQIMQLVWAVAYGVWLIGLKPRSDLLSVTGQAVVAQTVGLSALFLQSAETPLVELVLLGWVICYMSARHFFTSFEEPLNRFLSSVWGYFAAALLWLLGHWLLFYGIFAQPTILLTVIGFGLASIYYLEKTDRLSLGMRRQLLFVMTSVVIIMLIFSDWGNKAI